MWGQNTGYGANPLQAGSEREDDPVVRRNGDYPPRA
jgi:hypothetical protein